MTLAELGWDAAFAEAFEPHDREGLVPARVAAQHRGAYVLLTYGGVQLTGRLAGSLRHEIDWKTGLLPAVGDWVAVLVDDAGELATIRAVLPRRSAFSRKAATGVSDRSDQQVVAANVDTVFLVAALGRDLNPRRLERYLATAWESGSQPVIVLTKTDLHPDDVPAALAEVEAIAYGVPIHAVSGVTGDGVEALASYLQPGKTVALLGSSGVGKSTLVNLLAGREVLAVREVRESDERGRHTTSHRELVPLPGGALVLDTPGMRELQLWDAGAGVQETFTDVLDLAAECRFSDCAHDREPGCAIRAALGNGTLDHDRWHSYTKLQRELRALEVRQNARLKAEATKAHRRMARSFRKVKY